MLTGPMSPELAAALVRSLFCGCRPGEKRMSVYVAYSDEAGVADPEGEFLVAGYIACEDEWPWVASAWQERVLGGSPSLPYLHMNEIRREEWRAERHISFVEAESRISEAVRVMKSSGSVFSIASVIKRSDLHEIFHNEDFKITKKRIVVGLDEPDYLCFIGYAAYVLAHVYQKHPDVEKVNFIVSPKKKISHRIGLFHAGMKRYLDPKLLPLLGELIPCLWNLSSRFNPPIFFAGIFSAITQRPWTGRIRKDSIFLSMAMKVTRTIGIGRRWKIWRDEFY